MEQPPHSRRWPFSLFYFELNDEEMARIAALNRNEKHGWYKNMKIVKITVLRRSFNEDMAKEYGVADLKVCSALKDGEVFFSGLGKPDGFCDGAWHAIYPYVFALANGARSFWFKDSWVRSEGVAIACCNDGLRPVFFKLEATDEEICNEDNS